MQEHSLLILSGFPLTIVIDLINSRIKGGDTRKIISYLVCSTWGSAINFIEHNGVQGYAGMSMVDIVTSYLVSIGAVWAFSQVAYKGIPKTDVNWENAKMRSDLGLNAKVR